MKRVVVIGGGASGLMAAYAAAEGGNSVLLLEKNEKAGKKIYITGKGRCNLTNDCPPDRFLQNVVRGSKFLMGAIHRFSPADTMEWMQAHGLPLVTERGNRVFPKSMHASDVTKTLEKACAQCGVTVRMNTRAEKILMENGAVKGVVADGETIAADCVIVATGGLSYPSTGSTGDGYRFAADAGHSVVPCVPSLTGFETAEDCTPMQGISLKNVVLTAERAKKRLFSEQGELLFTHYGVSGPLVLSLSAVLNRLPMREIALSIDLKPALDEQKLDRRLLRDLGERANEQMKHVARGVLPGGLSAEVLRRAAIPPELKANLVTRTMRSDFEKVIKNFTLTPRSLRGFEEAVVTSGGVDLKEVDPRTMESKKTHGLFFCGEVLDVDALTGGFNLQIAFTTGFLAGKGTIS